VTGSLAFVAAARAAYIVAKDQTNPARRLVLPIKNNLGTDETGYAFHVEPAELPGGIRTSRIIWEAERVTLTANEALAPAQAMEDLLAAGPMKASDVQREARQAGIGDKPLRMARERLRIRPRKRAFADGWEWALPPPDDTPNVEGSAGHFPGAAKAPMRAEEPDSEVL
jgi:hypothetical protein